MVRAVVLLVLTLALAGCVPRGEITRAQNSAGLVTQTVYVATDRAAQDTAGRFSEDRGDGLTFGRYRISIPPTHSPGQIDWPRGAPDPATDMLAVEETVFSSPRAFDKGLSQTLNTLPRGQREVVVFVHGFNTNFAEGLYRMAQMAHDYKLPGPVVHYSWPSAAHPLGYAYDRDSALFARDGLADLLSRLRRAGAERILLTAHSMGSLLAMETLRQTAIAGDRRVLDALSGVVLVSPDIDVDLFLSQARRIGPLPQPFIVFTSKRDRVLALSARLTGKRDRLGSVETLEKLSDLDITFIDVSNVGGDRLGHFVTATSPSLIAILSNLSNYDAAVQGGPSGRLGLLPGTVLTVQNATQIILPPLP